MSQGLWGHSFPEVKKYMFKKLLWLTVLLVFIGAVWAFVQYREVAAEAEAQIQVDTDLLKQDIELKRQARQGPFKEVFYEKLELVESRLIVQSINENRQLVRHYHSLFIYQGHTRCLLSKMYYPQRQGTVLSQRWLPEGTDCLPF